MRSVWALVIAAVLAALSAGPRPACAGAIAFTWVEGPDGEMILVSPAEARLRENALLREAVAQVLPEALDLLHRSLASIAPGFLHGMPQPVQDAARNCGAQPARSHALILGVEQTDLGRSMPGTENDASLLANALTIAGVDPKHIHSLTGAEASRIGLSERLFALVQEVGCGDTVLIHFSSSMGQEYSAAENLHWAWRRSWAPPQTTDASHKRHVLAWKALAAELERDFEWNDAAFWMDEALRFWKFLDDAALANGLAHTEDPLTRRLRQLTLPAGAPELMIGLTKPEAPGLEFVLGAELADAMAAIRQAGASVVAVIDVPMSARARLIERQQGGAFWQADHSGNGNLAVQEPWTALGAGDIVAIYAADDDAVSTELALPPDDPEAEIYGPLSFLLAMALIDTPALTPRGLSERLAQGAVGLGLDSDFTRFRVQASAPDRPLLAEAEAAPAVPLSSGGAIRILSPAPTRGAAAMEDEIVALEGLVDWPHPVLGVFVNDQSVPVDPTGSFRVNLRLDTGLNRVFVSALTRDRQPHSTVLELTWRGDLQALEGARRRFAVTIANQTYDRAATGFSTLATPIADARAVAEVLSRRFGFVTEAEDSRGAFSLVLEDPDQRSILRTLNRLAEVAGPRDEVLIFYAGHGRSDPQLGSAAWVPADAEAGFPDSFLASSTLSNALQRFQAGNLILIVDSCYAGGMFRAEAAVAEAMAADETRIASLLRQQARRSRVLITSGNDEPVLDQGGAGHSIFARALLIGLEEMDEEAFGARELFERHLRLQVSGLAAQEPQLRDMIDIGHEGGDFVFVGAGGLAGQGGAARP